MTRPPALPHCPAAFRPGGPRQVTAYFEEQVGPVNCVRFRRHARSKDFKGSVMVEFGCDAQHGFTVGLLGGGADKLFRGGGSHSEHAVAFS